MIGGLVHSGISWALLAYRPSIARYLQLVACSVGPILHLASLLPPIPCPHQKLRSAMIRTLLAMAPVATLERFSDANSNSIVSCCCKPVFPVSWADYADLNGQTVKRHKRPAEYSSGKNDRIPRPSPPHPTAEVPSGDTLTGRCITRHEVR